MTYTTTAAARWAPIAYDVRPMAVVRDEDPIWKQCSPFIQNAFKNPHHLPYASDWLRAIAS